MRKLCQVLKIYTTANFIEKSNADGRRINGGVRNPITITAPRALEKIVQSVKGVIIPGEKFLQILLPLEFSNNAVDTSILQYFPADLVFNIHCSSMETLSFAGLHFDRKFLFLTPGNNLVNYTFHQQQLACKQFGTGGSISQDDLFDRITAKATFDEIRALAGRSVGSLNHPYDLKISSGTDTIAISTPGDLRKFHLLLRANLNKTIPLGFRRNSTDQVLKDFPAILVTQNPPDKALIGMLSLPKSSLVVTATDPLEYPALNNYIVHFPNVTPIIDLTLNVNMFTGGSRLFFNESEILNPAVTDHPAMPNYKQVKGNTGPIAIYLDEAQQVKISNGTAQTIIPVDAMHHYHPGSNTSRIKVTKQIS